MALSADWMRPSCAKLSLAHDGASGNVRDDDVVPAPGAAYASGEALGDILPHLRPGARITLFGAKTSATLLSLHNECRIPRDARFELPVPTA
jgi:hypothetical protein